MHEFLRGLLCGLTLLAAMPPADQDRLEEAKEQLNFSSWPGKTGPLKPGLKFDPGSVAALSGYSVKQDIRQAAEDGRIKSVQRRLLVANGKRTVRMDIRVCQEGNSDAHEALLGTMKWRSAPLGLFKRGDQNGIAVGDVNFVRETDPAKVEFIDFVRNNIVVCLSKSDDSTVDVVALATAIDAQIVAEPNFTKETIKTQIPTIGTFAPKSGTIPPLSSTPLTLNVTDPQGRTLEYQLSGHLGRIKRDDTVSPPALTYDSDDRLGRAKIALVVINENLLFDRAAISITIAK